MPTGYHDPKSQIIMTIYAMTGQEQPKNDIPKTRFDGIDPVRLPCPTSSNHLAEEGRLMSDEDRPASEADNQRQRLLQYRFGDLLTWKAPVLVKSIGPFNPEAFRPFDDERLAMIEACVAKLASFTDEEIATISAPGGRDTMVGRNWSQFRMNDPQLLSRRQPPWYLGGLGHPDYAADFEHWTKMPHFKVSELTTLSVGVEPSAFGWRNLVELASSAEREKFVKPIEFLLKRYDKLHRQFSHSGRDTTVLPTDFLRWASKFRVEVHAGFLGPLVEFHQKETTDSPTSVARKPDKREIDSVAQLFTAMAIEYFGYVPDRARNTTTRDILSLASSMGMSITEDTILKYLKHGASFISQDWVPHER